MASSSSSSSSPPSISQLIKTYDVFVSFRGSDVRDGFLSFLVEALRGKDVYPFVDELLVRGEDVSRSLLDKIEDSYISLIIFSEKYAFSPWCLEELEKIVECRKTMGQIVIPVFYGIDPSHVQDLTGEYGKALDEHRKNIELSSSVENWAKALQKVSVLSGLVSYNIRPETKLVEEIVYHILEKIRSIGLNNSYNEELVGIDSRIQSVESLLCLDSQNVRIVGIWGAAGIGKSTVANKIYHRIKVQFTSHCLIENASQKGSVLNEILYALLGQRISNESNCTMLPLPIQQRLEKRKVLIVVDDVRDIKPLDLLLRKPDTIYGPGSRILITSREIQPLRNANTEIYEVKPLDNNEALELFCLHAFKQRSPKQEFEALSERAVKYARGIPSALKDLGTTLYYGSVEEWEDELENMKTKSDSDQKIVKVVESEDRTVLKLSQFGSKKLTSELSSHSNLTVIWLTNSAVCHRVPPLDQLYSLRELYFDNLIELEYVDCMGDNSVARGGKFFPSLKKLWIWNCPNLIGWRKKQAYDGATATQLQPWFPCLSLLEIKNCPKLSWIPLFPFLDERLYYVNSGSQPLQQTMKMRMESAQNYPLSKLQELWISELSELEYMDGSDDTSLYEQEGGSKLFPFLKKLWIENCPNLKGWWNKRDEATTSTELPYFLCLSFLEIKNCPRLKCMPLFPSLEERLYYVNVAIQPLQQTMKMKMEYSATPLERVRELWISDLPDLDYIDLNEDNYFNQGGGATVFSFLKKLWIYNCPNLKGWWKRRDDDRAATTEQRLPHFPCLNLLEIKQCPKLSWMPLFPSLDQRLYYVKTGVQPLLQTIMVSSFSSLEELWLSELADLNYFDKSTVFLSLKKLWIDYCPNFEGWWRKTDEDTTSRQLPQFRWLSILKIKHCTKLSCMPLFPSINETLHYVAAGVEPLLQTMKMKTTLTNLTELWLSELPDLEYIDSSEVLLKGSTVLPSLKKLWIDYCPNLKGWWKESGYDTNTAVELPQFPYLSLLEIKHCPKLRLMPQFSCLDDELKLEYASTEPLQKTMQMMNCLSKLKVMWIVGIEDVESLPKTGLQNLISLRELHIKDCPRLSSLSEEMRLLSSLVKLVIKGCPLLVGRCKENGAEWPNIKHIPDIESD